PQKKESPPTKSPQKKSECSELHRVLRVLPKIPHHKIPLKKIRVLRAAPKSPSTTKKAKKKIATRQAGSNHHIKQLLSLNQKI
ncbi:MAG: hypothetical protein PUI32_09285, partial [Bacteroidales bacterium]|nr:hypothetical protein [Bacteroidales bacterium]MDY5207040.1 hypothetical protein [Sodaliphilus sp.]